MKRIIFKIIMLLILLIITCSHSVLAEIDKDTIKCLDGDGKACQIETVSVKPGANATIAETTITVLKSNNIYVNEELTLSITSTRGLWDGEINVVPIAYNDDEMKVKFNKKEEIDYEYDWFNSVTIKKLQIIILKEGTYTYSFKIKDKNLTETINITIEGVTKNPAVLEAEQEEKELQTNWQREPSESADARTIKYFILSDKANNASKGLTEIAQKNLSKIKKWKETIDAFIKTDKNHYGQTYQYGSIQSLLDELITASEKGQSIEDAINNNSSAIDSTYNLIKESIERRIKIGYYQDSDDKPRENVIFTDVLTDIDSYIPTNKVTDGRLVNKVNVILTIITNIGMVLAVLMLAILGIKYMLGSLEEKAEYKKDMIPYLIGAFLLFGITTIVKVLQQLGQSINNI